RLRRERRGLVGVGVHDPHDVAHPRSSDPAAGQPRLRSPIPSDPSPEGGGTGAEVTASISAGCGSSSASSSPPGGSSRNSALGTKNRLPVSAVEKSRIRSVLPGG